MQKIVNTSKDSTKKSVILTEFSETNSDYIFKKLDDWAEDYDWIEWEDFKNNWFYCDTCGEYSEGQCLCYAR